MKFLVARESQPRRGVFRMTRRARRCAPCLLALAVLLGARPATAIVHMWDMAEIYSNADGSVQFIELFTTSGDEFGWSAAAIASQSTGIAISFHENLDGSTANRRVLLATPGFGSLPGGVPPDFEIPAGFFDPAGDTLTFSFGLDVLSFAPGQLPLDGEGSLHRVLEIPSPQLPTSAGPADLFVGSNSPTNFAGDTGHVVPEPGTAALLLAGVATLAQRCRARV